MGRRLILCSLQDQLSADMYNFVAKEVDYANYFQTVSATRPHGTPWLPSPAVGVTAGAVCPPQLIEVQAEYHRKSLALLQNVLPQIKAQQGKCLRGLSRSCMRHRGLCLTPELRRALLRR